MKKQLVRFLVAMFLLVCGGVAADAPPAKFDGSTIHPYTNAWKFSVTPPDGITREQGIWSDQVEAVTFDGRKAMQRTQVAKYNKKDIEITTVNVFDPKTMQPLRMDWKKDEGNYNHRVFNGRKLSFHRLATPPGGEEVHGTKEFPHKFFDFYGGMYGLLFAAAPLKDGYAGSFPSIAEDKEELQTVTFRVTGREKVAAGPGKEVEAWVVDCDSALGPMRFWLTQTAPYIIRLQYEGSDPNNKDKKYKWTYEMV